MSASTSSSVAEHRHLSRQLFSMTWPMMFGILSLMSFQLVDSAFIGQLGVLPLAAQGFTLPMQMVVIGLQVGLGIATTSLISRVLGSGKTQRAQQLGGLVVITGAVAIFLLAWLIWLLRGPLLLLLGAPENVAPVIDDYWPVWLASAWTGAMLYFAYSLCRANGNTMLPGSMMVVTSLLNMAFDPLFIFYVRYGLTRGRLGNYCCVWYWHVGGVSISAEKAVDDIKLARLRYCAFY